MPAEYTLYELTPVEGQMENRFSPFVWRAKSDLALLGVQYDTVPYTFPQIRKDLAAATGNDKVTVPTLKPTGGDPAYVTDSWAIAEYFDKKQPGILFPTPDAKLLAHFLQLWVDNELAVAIRPLFRPCVVFYLDAASREYWLSSKSGVPRADAPALCRKIAADLADPQSLAELTANARAKLAIFEQLLGDTPGPFVLGDTPSHCDSTVFGWFVTTQINAEQVNPGVWFHESLPRVGRWAKAFSEATGWTTPFEAVSEAHKAEVLAQLR